MVHANLVTRRRGLTEKKKKKTQTCLLERQLVFYSPLTRKLKFVLNKRFEREKKPHLNQLLNSREKLVTRKVKLKKISGERNEMP